MVGNAVTYGERFITMPINFVSVRPDLLITISMLLALSFLSSVFRLASLFLLLALSFLSSVFRLVSLFLPSPLLRPLRTLQQVLHQEYRQPDANKNAHKRKNDWECKNYDYHSHKDNELPIVHSNRQRHYACNRQ
ncbi:hypothetical protein THIOKS11650011 [Thiocapsa sp. KS1]|nr:hypothetical protein THIOKS11650011 [Thiocapsa sp. KS1]